MAPIDNDVPFPQADDFTKIIKLMEISDESYLSDYDFISTYLDGITIRQVCYYMSAAMYLGLIDRKKHFTEIGEEIRNRDNYSRIIEYIRLLISDPVIGSVFISQKILKTEYSAEDAGEIIRNYYPNYCEPIYKRRGQTALSWTKWIKNYME